MIDWNSIISNLKNGQVVTVNPARWNMDNPKYREMVELWESNNFNTGSVRWINYYDTKDIETTIAKQVGITPLRSWISCVEPGYMTGYHYDIDDNEQEYLTHGTLTRYTVFISKPALGHIFILGNDYLINQPQGTLLKWQQHREWHNGINGGFSNKYLFHILGY
jgi:hypothetical protein